MVQSECYYNMLRLKEFLKEFIQIPWDAVIPTLQVFHWKDLNDDINSDNTFMTKLG